MTPGRYRLCADLCCPQNPWMDFPVRTAWFWGAAGQSLCVPMSSGFVWLCRWPCTAVGGFAELPWQGAWKMPFRGGPRAVAGRGFCLFRLFPRAAPPALHVSGSSWSPGSVPFVNDAYRPLGLPGLLRNRLAFAGFFPLAAGLKLR